VKKKNEENSNIILSANSGRILVYTK